MKNKWYFWGICTFLAYLFLGQLLTFTPYIVTQILIISDALSNQNVALLTSIGTRLNQPDIFEGRLRTIPTNPTDSTFSLLYCEYISEPVPSDFHSNEDVE